MSLTEGSPVSEDVELINDDPYYGRVVKTCRAFRKGEVVFREYPLLVWNESDENQYIVEFLKCSSEIQNVVLDMFHPPLSDSTNRVMEQRAASIRIYETLECLSSEVIHKLLLIRDTNCHTFYGELCNADDPSSDRSQLALFALGSKVAHCCDPNCTYTSKWGDCMSTFIANKNISIGEMLSYSYIDCYESPTFIRRDKLLDEKAFYCNCRRCFGPDLNRGFLCSLFSDCEDDDYVGMGCRDSSSKAPCEGVLSCSDSSNLWSCSLCSFKGDNSIIIQQECELVARFQELKDIGHQNYQILNLKYLDSFLEELLLWLPPTNYVVTDFLQFYNMIGTSQCLHFKQMIVDNSISEISQIAQTPEIELQLQWELYINLKVKTIDSAIKLIQCIECSVADCFNGNNSCGFCHPVVISNEVARYAAWIFNDLLEIEGYARLYRGNRDSQIVMTNSQEFSRRYFQVMRCVYGEQDEDVIRMKAFV